MKKRAFALGAVVAVVAAVIAVAARPSPVLANVLQRAASGQLRQAFIDSGQGRRPLPFLSSGLVEAATNTTEPGSTANAPNAVQPLPSTPASGPSGCGSRNSALSSVKNVRVNQDCTYRLQAEEGIAFNPAAPANLIAGMNDERQGFNLGAFAYSFDSGNTWGDGPPPFYQKINEPLAEKAGVGGDPNTNTITGLPGNGFTYDGGTDPMLAFDGEGRAFYGLVLFDRDLGNGAAVMVTQSPAGAGGSFYYTPDTFSRNFVVEEDNDPAVQADKPFLTVDTGAGSPNHDNVYVTWTIFFADARGAVTQSPIYGSMSTDHALTWSTPELISGSSNTLCFFGNFFEKKLNPNACNFDQGSDPTVLPNGDLEVVYNNGNTPAGDPNGQQLAVHCAPSGSSTSGTAHLNCGAPAKVGDDILQGEPQCDFGRGPEQCIPGSFVRNDDFPRIAENHGNGDLFVTWNDFRNGEYDIQMSRSTDGGKTWSAATAPLNRDQGVDHYQSAPAVVCSGTLTSGNPACPANGAGASSLTGDGASLCGSSNTTESGAISSVTDHVAVSYYRTCQIPNEATACPLGSTLACAPSMTGVQNEPSDYDLLGGFGLATPYTGSPVSPVFSPPLGGREVGFIGDYSGIAVLGTSAHPIWADPRNVVPVAFREPQADQQAINDNDIFTADAVIPGS